MRAKGAYGKRRGRRRLLWVLALAAASAGGTAYMIRMPGESYRGPLEPLTAAQEALAAELRRDVVRLASEIGERNVFHHRALEEAARHVEGEPRRAGLKVSRQAFSARDKPCWNIEDEVAGGSAAAEIVVVGGHCDSERGSPGANDNATGAAAVLVIVRRFAGRKPARTLRFVAFVDNLGSRALVRRATGALRAGARFPSKGGAPRSATGPRRGTSTISRGWWRASRGSSRISRRAPVAGLEGPTWTCGPSDLLLPLAREALNLIQAMRVYLESTIPSYVVARPARDLLQAARQQLTRDWWDLSHA